MRIYQLVWGRKSFKTNYYFCWILSLFLKFSVLLESQFLLVWSVFVDGCENEFEGSRPTRFKLAFSNNIFGNLLNSQLALVAKQCEFFPLNIVNTLGYLYIFLRNSLDFKLNFKKIIKMVFTFFNQVITNSRISH